MAKSVGSITVKVSPEIDEDFIAEIRQIVQQEVDARLQQISENTLDNLRQLREVINHGLGVYQQHGTEGISVTNYGLAAYEQYGTEGLDKANTNV